MKYLLFFLLAFILLSFQSCKEEDEPLVTSPFTVKYEIIATNQTITKSYLSYMDEDQRVATVDDLTFTNTWSKSIIVLSANRPLSFSLTVDAPLYTDAKGTIKVNIYINDKLKATVSKETDNTGTSHLYLPFSVNYSVK